MKLVLLPIGKIVGIGSIKVLFRLEESISILNVSPTLLHGLILAIDL